jgi:site-specific DNA-methyltransferase (adenine-specific)
MSTCPPFKKQCSVKPYYRDNAVTIYHGDCREIVPQLGKFDLLLTDPPYGINAARHRKCQKNGWRDYGSKEESAWDNKPASTEDLLAFSSACRFSTVWGGNYFALPPRMGWFVWDKGQRDFDLADCELAWTSENRAARIIELSRAEATFSEPRQHPTQKPVRLMIWCISKFDEAQTILDPFMGSGTTLRAAKDLGRKAVGIEIEERYCEIAAKRMAQEVLAL